MWQFMRGTGRRFLRIDAAVDERLDPYRSTEAAASFLEQNYIVLGSWPLALTAYNHGPGGMKRAQEQLGTSDIVTVVRKYNSRSFGFASRNFYVAFLAALEIDSNPEKFFGSIRRNATDTSIVLEVPAFLPASRLANVLELDRDELQRLNPSLLPSVWRGARHVPRGFELRVPNTHRPQHCAQPAFVRRALRRAGRRVAASRAQRREPVGDRFALQRQRRHDRGTQQPRSSLPYSGRAGAGVAGRSRRPGAGRGRRIERQARTRSRAGETADSADRRRGQREKRYVVKRGDTLGKIASRHGMTEESLMELNNIRNRNFLYEGQVLALARSARAAPPVEAEVPVEVVASAPVAEPAADTEAAEPVSEREAEEIGPALVAGTQAADSADPADYSVGGDDNVVLCRPPKRSVTTPSGSTCAPATCAA